MLSLTSDSVSTSACKATSTYQDVCPLAKLTESDSTTDMKLMCVCESEYHAASLNFQRECRERPLGPVKTLRWLTIETIALFGQGVPVMEIQADPEYTWYMASRSNDSPVIVRIRPTHSRAQGETVRQRVDTIFCTRLTFFSYSEYTVMESFWSRSARDILAYVISNTGRSLPSDGRFFRVAKDRVSILCSKS